MYYIGKHVASLNTLSERGTLIYVLLNLRKTIVALLIDFLSSRDISKFIILMASSFTL